MTKRAMVIINCDGRTRRKEVCVRGQGQSEWQDCELLGHSLECESQEQAVMGGCLAVKVSIVQIH